MKLFIAGHGLYQFTVLMVMLEVPQILPSKIANLTHMESGHGNLKPNEHFTLIFTSFVMMQIFNELNSRHLNFECNIFRGLLDNPIFVVIVVGTFGVQILLTEFGGIAFFLDGLNGVQWAIAISLGVSSLVWQLLLSIPARFIDGNEKPVASVPVESAPAVVDDDNEDDKLLTVAPANLPPAAAAAAADPEEKLDADVISAPRTVSETTHRRTSSARRESFRPVSGKFNTHGEAPGTLGHGGRSRRSAQDLVPDVLDPTTLRAVVKFQRMSYKAKAEERRADYQRRTQTIM